MDWTIRRVQTRINTIEDRTRSGSGVRYLTEEGSFFTTAPVVDFGRRLGLDDQIELNVAPCGDGSSRVSEWRWRGQKLFSEVYRPKRTLAQVTTDWQSPPSLYLHGTSTKHWPQIQREGLCEPYLASNLGLASYYANVCVEEVGGKPLVLECTDLEENLRHFDAAAFEEPVLCEEGCAELAAQLAGQPLDEDTWRVSWAGVGSLKYGGEIAAVNLKRRAVDGVES
jgi:hypothetical protein